MSQTRYCPNHRDTPTTLQCSKCADLICPSCLVHTSVGVRCRDCARVGTGAAFGVSTPILARAMVSSLILGIVLGVAYDALEPQMARRLLLDALGMGIIGYIIGEAVKLATDRGRGRTLQVVAAGGVVVAILTSSFNGATYGALLGTLVGIYVAVTRLR